MTRKYIDCREYPSESHCSLAMAADSDEELLEAAVQHAVAVHGHRDGMELRNQLRTLFREGTPLEDMPQAQSGMLPEAGARQGRGARPDA